MYVQDVTHFLLRIINAGEMETIKAELLAASRVWCNFWQKLNYKKFGALFQGVTVEWKF